MIKTAILTGTTASGKTTLAIEFAQRSSIPMEIINADSLLFYREVEIGVAKPTLNERGTIKHHLIDIASPSETITAGRFVELAKAAILDIHQRGNRALVVGGSGFYLKALVRGLWAQAPGNPEIKARLSCLSLDDLYTNLESIDPKRALKIGKGDRYRLIRALEIYETTKTLPSLLEERFEESASHHETTSAFEVFKVDRRQDELAARISSRTEAMIQAGLIDEAQSLVDRYPHSRLLGSVGYKQCVAYFNGITPQGRKIAPGLAGLRSEIHLATQQLAKNQRTFLKSQIRGEWFILDEDKDRLIRNLNAIYADA